MAYCLRSFIETLDQVLNPYKHSKKWVLNQNHRPQIQSLFQNATFLQDFLDKSSPQIQQMISLLEDQIMDAAQKAADTLETNITYQILSNPKDQGFTIFPPDMGQVIRVFEDARQQVSKIKNASQSWNNQVSPPVSRTRYPDSEIVVGLKEDLDQLKDRLTSARRELDIIPIVGMGGIGKTTLARIIYDEFSSKSHFDRCAWVTVSQSYDLQQILKSILACVTTNMLQQDTTDLKTTVYQALHRTRYLIVLDDIWSEKAWDDVKTAFSCDDNQGSRIIFTTRENSLVKYVGSSGHEMRLIDDDKSWELLTGTVFRQEESCPCELEEVGKSIAKKCGGLPLALQVIGGLLANSHKNKDFWKYVELNVSSLIAKTNDQFAGIFSWSFTHLPHYLKPCFLYMGAFPEDYEIPASRLIKLWVAEGFLYPVPNKSIEEAAEKHLNALVDRNLIFVRTTKNGKTKAFGIHDLLRDLCMRKAQEKKFLYVKNSKTDILPKDILCLRRVSVHLSFEDVKNAFGALRLTSLARSLLLTGNSTHEGFKSRLCYKSSLLRVLDVKSFEGLDLQEALLRVSNMKSFKGCDLQGVFLQLVNLRYLSINNNPLSTGDVSVLKNLQTLTVLSLKSLTILDHLPQLRNLKFQTLEDKNSPYSLEYPHENLQRLSKIPLDNLTYLLENFPNLRKLVIDTEDSLSLYHSVVDLTCFHKLESLEFSSKEFYTLFSNTILFPPWLKTLKLIKCALGQKLLSAISVLPELQVLRFGWCEFEDDTWEPTRGEFCQLEYLKIDWSKIQNWSADENQFPVLRQLVLDRVPYVSEIPDHIKGIETLQMIELNYCKASVFEFAREIQEEQFEYGNTLFQLRLGQTIEDFDKEQAEKGEGKEEGKEKNKNKDREGSTSNGGGEEEDDDEGDGDEDRGGSTSDGRKLRTWARKKAKDITNVRIPKYLKKITKIFEKDTW